MTCPSPHGKMSQGLCTQLFQARLRVQALFTPHAVTIKRPGLEPGTWEPTSVSLGRSRNFPESQFPRLESGNKSACCRVAVRLD